MMTEHWIGWLRGIHAIHKYGNWDEIAQHFEQGISATIDAISEDAPFNESNLKLGTMKFAEDFLRTAGALNTYENVMEFLFLNEVLDTSFIYRRTMNSTKYRLDVTGIELMMSNAITISCTAVGYDGNEFVTVTEWHGSGNSEQEVWCPSLANELTMLIKDEEMQVDGVVKAGVR